MSCEELLRQIGPVLRARDFRLYTQGRGRLVDLWQFGGAAVLGHTPSGVVRELKNTAERGLFTPFPHPLEKRFTKALSQLFPDKQYRVYADDASLRRSLTQAGYDPEAPFWDPALGSPLSSDAAPSLWRPFLKEDDPLSFSASETAPLVIPIVPWSLAPKVLVFPESLERVRRFPPSDSISPVLLAGAARSVYDLIAAAPNRGKAVFPGIQKALVNSPWRRQGIYLNYAEPLDDASFIRLFLDFLESGFLLPPYQKAPLILPGILSPGEEAKLAARLINSR
ncbi:MAG: hypothetical protein LBD29_10835 [Treponema sp.]|jgi:hypothetical protein|nr:hypothetical protein [Treponema sp.]